MITLEDCNRMKKIKIIIADDHSIVRSGIKRILLDYQDISIVDEAEDGQDLLEKARKNKYDVVLLDITMPGRSGLEILKQLKIEKPEIPMLGENCRQSQKAQWGGWCLCAKGFTGSRVVPEAKF